MWQNTYRFRKPQDVVHELSLSPAKHVIMVDDNTLDFRDSSKLAKMIERADLNKSLQIYGRAKKVANDPKLVEKWRRAGMETLLIGLESIDKDRLKQMRKNSAYLSYLWKLASPSPLGAVTEREDITMTF